MRLTYMLLLILTYGCSENYRHGTSIIVAIGTDGIIIAADSRSVIIASESKTTLPKDFYGYFDSSQKIFNINGYPLSMAGFYSFNNEYFNKIVDQFNLLKIKPKNALDNMGYFMRYMFKTHPLTEDSIAKENQFFSAGYINDTPHIIWCTYARQLYFKDHFITTSSKFDSVFKKQYKLTNCNNLALIAEKALNNYIKDLKLKGSGGPIQIIKVTKDNNFYYIKNDFSKNPEGQKEMQKYK